MTFGIIVNETKDTDLSITRKLAGAIAARGGNAVITCGAAPDAFACPDDLLPLYVGGYSGTGPAAGAGGCGAESAADACGGALAGCDILISIGGDGTLIRVAREALYSGAPIVGVNLGSLGYLTEVETSQIDAMLDRIFKRDYRIEERMMLSVTRMRGDRPSGREETVLNELAIGRGDFPHVIKLKIYIDGTFLDIYPGDGILISTPTGSTAYSLSAGGPVIDPELAAISIVPVCPHVIFSRPVLIAPDKEITVVPVVSGGEFSATVSADGFRQPGLCAGELIKVRKSKHKLTMPRFDENNFYVVLKNKLFQSSDRL